MLSYFRFIYATFLLLFPAILIGNSNISIAPQYSYLLYDSQLRLADGNAYGLNILFNISDQFGISTGFSSSDSRQSFDVIGGQSFFDVNSTFYRINF